MTLRKDFFEAVSLRSDTDLMEVYRIESGIFGGPYSIGYRELPSVYTDNDKMDEMEKVLWALDIIATELGTAHQGTGDLQMAAQKETGVYYLNWFSCFLNGQQLKSWFELNTSCGYNEKVAVAMAKAGYGIAVYLVASQFVREHPHKDQAIFVKEKADLLRRLPVTPDILNLLH